MLFKISFDGMLDPGRRNESIVYSLPGRGGCGVINNSQALTATSV